MHARKAAGAPTTAGVRGKHENLLDGAIQFSGDLFRGSLPDSFGKPALVRSDQSGTCRAVIEYDRAYIEFFVRILAGRRIGWIRGRGYVHTRRAHAKVALGECFMSFDHGENDENDKRKDPRF